MSSANEPPRGRVTLLAGLADRATPATLSDLRETSVDLILAGLSGLAALAERSAADDRQADAFAHALNDCDARLADVARAFHVARAERD